MIDAHDTRSHGTAYGTSDHQHHRGFIEHGGIRVGYWRCARGTPEAPWCPDEPDPWAVLARKRAEARRPKRTPERVFCELHTPDRWRVYSGNRVCLDCRSDQRRTERIARRIERAAVKVA